MSHNSSEKGIHLSVDEPTESDGFNPESILWSEVLKDRKNRAHQICERVRDRLGVNLVSAIGLTSTAALAAFSNIETHKSTYEASGEKY